MRRARILAVLAVLEIGCQTVHETARPPSAPTASTDPAKFHTFDGHVFVLDSWQSDGQTITGKGAEYDVDRALVRQGVLQLRRRDVVLIETTHEAMRTAVIPMLLVTVASAALTVACATNPKACFGSCPTFYVPKNGGWAVQAEGFSTSIARSLEADDLDDLPDAHADGGFVTVAMRNEAFETHAVRSLELVVVDGPAGSTVVRTPDETFEAVGPTRPARSCAWESDACELLAERDGRELSPQSDGVDLAARTTATLRFDGPGSRRAGLVLTARNSLMSTFVLYEMFALHGRRAGNFIASVERRDPDALAGLVEFGMRLGGIDVDYRQGEGAWRSAGRVGYVGPIAPATIVVPLDLSTPEAPVEVRLTMARAHWRLDAARLGALVAEDLGAVDVPAAVADGGGREARGVERSLRGIGDYVVTLPGDEILLRFPVPASAGSRGYFLKSRGYYHEWMRDAWLREEDLETARRYLADPRSALRELAPAYRAVEPSMESIFQASRFARPSEARPRRP